MQYGPKYNSKTNMMVGKHAWAFQSAPKNAGGTINTDFLTISICVNY